MPLLVCIISGLFALYQFKVKRGDDQIFERLTSMEKNQESFHEQFTAFKKTLSYEKIRDELDMLEDHLKANDEITKRVELALMIHHHPEQTMIIEGLLEEYNGNHYIYKLAKDWVDTYNVQINPRVLNKLCRNSSTDERREVLK